jgi:hypothetical protein
MDLAFIALWRVEAGVWDIAFVKRTINVANSLGTH